MWCGYTSDVTNENGLLEEFQMDLCIERCHDGDNPSDVHNTIINLSLERTDENQLFNIFLWAG